MQRILLPLLALALATPATTAQDLETRDGRPLASVPGPTEPGPDLEVVPSLFDGVGLEEWNGHSLALGPAYRAFLEPERVLFHPALGEVCPTTQHLEFRLEAVTLGGEPLVEVAPTVARRDGTTATYDRGAVLERYEVRPDGLEQSFVVLERPPVAGDLVVRGRLGSSLPAPAAGRSDDGLAFVHPTWGGVTLGGVTGVSADGTTVAGELRFDGSHVEYVLPAAFVARAAFPLVVDPLIGTAAQLDGGAGISRGNADIAYGGLTDEYLAVWNTAYALDDFDVRSRMLDGDGNPTGFAMSVRLTIGTVSAIPSVGYVAGAGGFVVAWSEGTLLGQRDVWARSFAPGVPVWSPPVAIADGPTNQTEPDVGGDSLDDASALNAVVVWRESGVGVWSALVQPFAFTPPVVNGTLLAIPADSTRYPTISKSGGVPGRWLIAAERFFSTPAPGDYDLAWAVVDFALGFAAGPGNVDAIGSNEQRPACDGDGSTFVLAWQTDVTGDWDVAWRSVDSDGVFGPITDVLSGNTLDQTEPTVSFTGNKYVLTHEYESSSTNLQLTELCAQGLVPCKPPQTLLPITDRAYAASASKRSGDADDLGDEGVLVWSNSGGATSTIEGHPFDGTVGGAVENLGGGCGATISVSTSAPPALGHPGFGWELDIPGGASFVILNARFNPGAYYTCGSCSIMANLGIVLSAPVFGTSASFATPIPADTMLDNRQVTTQFFVFPTTETPCSLFSNASASDRIRITIKN